MQLLKHNKDSFTQPNYEDCQHYCNQLKIAKVIQDYKLLPECIMYKVHLVLFNIQVMAFFQSKAKSKEKMHQQSYQK